MDFAKSSNVANFHGVALNAISVGVRMNARFPSSLYRRMRSTVGLWGFGSAFHIPTRVQFDRPNPGPWSQTAAPFHEWRTNDRPFPLETIVEAWNLNPPVAAKEEAKTKPSAAARTEASAEFDLDDEIPF